MKMRKNDKDELKLDILKAQKKLHKDMKAFASFLGIDAHFYLNSTPLFYRGRTWYENVVSRNSFVALFQQVRALADALGYEFENVEAHVVAKKKES
jgi:hypothetical protein